MFARKRDMDHQLLAGRAKALRCEAVESRRLACGLSDRRSISDLEHYALELETQASELERNARLQSGVRALLHTRA